VPHCGARVTERKSVNLYQLSSILTRPPVHGRLVPAINVFDLTHDFETQFLTQGSGMTQDLRVLVLYGSGNFAFLARVSTRLPTGTDQVIE
jgi:hypothetical protein